jgi:hypothetical protein
MITNNSIQFNFFISLAHQIFDVHVHIDKTDNSERERKSEHIQKNNKKNILVHTKYTCQTSSLLFLKNVAEFKNFPNFNKSLTLLVLNNLINLNTLGLL